MREYIRGAVISSHYVPWTPPCQIQNHAQPPVKTTHTRNSTQCLPFFGKIKVWIFEIISRIKLNPLTLFCEWSDKFEFSSTGDDIQSFCHSVAHRPIYSEYSEILCDP